MPEVTTPPGELMYIETSFFGFSASRNKSCATTKVATPSSIGPVMKMILSLTRITRASLAAAARRVIYFPTSGFARCRISAGRFVVLVELLSPHLALFDGCKLQQEIDHLLLKD